MLNNKRLIALFIMMLAICSSITTSQAGTFYILNVPEKADDYCRHMPFDFVDDKVRADPSVRIIVEKPVQLTFSQSGWRIFRPVTGMKITANHREIAANKLSARQYQYLLKPLPAGQFYILGGELTSPTTGLRVCVQTLNTNKTQP
ncbi:hypothetical protein ACEYX6_00960 [Acinetobacter sp. c2-A9]|uniref:hypothetical protein n=1 Tax=Acinetobacter sp. c2-A9 TaxID=3342802 RepID=UPI0035BA734E